MINIHSNLYMICSIFTRDQPLHWVFSHVGWTSSSNSQCVCNHSFSVFYFNHLCNILYNFQFFCIIHNQFSCISSHQHHQKTLPPGLFYQEGLPSLKNNWWYFTLNLCCILKKYCSIPWSLLPAEEYWISILCFLKTIT